MHFRGGFGFGRVFGSADVKLVELEQLLTFAGWHHEIKTSIPAGHTKPAPARFMQLGLFLRSSASKPLTVGW